MPETNNKFAEWLADVLPTIPISLAIKHSSRVPGGIQQECRGIEAVLRSYRWQAQWIDRAGLAQKSDNWATTQVSLFKLKTWLTESISQTASQDEFQKACEAVIVWGGGARSGNNGAKGFILSKVKDGDLRSYFAIAKTVMSLNSPQPVSGINCMNAMLIKMHSLLSDDGLPIYDSRVAGCAGALAELYYRAHGIEEMQTDVPDLPGTDDKRRISRLIDGCRIKDVIRYSSPVCAIRWASAAIALGRLFRNILILRPELFREVEGVPNRMHALEATMFMIGADLNSLRPAFNQYSRRPVKWM